MADRRPPSAAPTGRPALGAAPAGSAGAELAGDPDLLILHEGPPDTRPEQRGSIAVEQVLRERPPPLTVCGHMNWPIPVSVLTGPTAAGATPYVVNVDSRMIVLTP